MKSKLKVAPKNSKNRKTYLESFGKSDVQVDIFNNSDIELTLGENVSKETEQLLVKAILEKGYEDLNKAVIYKKLPQGSCTCGAHKVKSEGHYDWCDGLISQQKRPPSNNVRYTKVGDLPSGGAVWYDEDAHDKGMEGNFATTHPTGKNMYPWYDHTQDQLSDYIHASDTDLDDLDESEYPNHGFDASDITDEFFRSHYNPAKQLIRDYAKKRYLNKSAKEEMIEYLEKKEWSPKAKHKSDKGGLTAAGRASYNKATGGNLKAPQPGGGPRKRSFCARNGGQIRMHNIDCRKTPDKRACKARRRWKC